MVKLVMVRHAPTVWNALGRYQGRTDTDLSDEGREILAHQQVPDSYRALPWVTSPLIRTMETAERLSLPAIPEPAVIEMSWGDWEGENRVELRARLGDEMKALEDQGLDFRAPGGESPREVQARVLAWARTLTQDTGVVSHKGVIRAVYAAATGWPMLGKPPHKLNWRCLHVFDITTTTVEPVSLNVPLEDL